MTRTLRTSAILAIALVSSALRGEAPAAAKITQAAMAQVGITTIYDPSYVRLRYPGGDLPQSRGVCADVIVRAFRAAGVDLQVAVHEDMAQHFSAYPRMWNLRAPDTNIDHRRVPNLMRFFERRGKSLAIDADYQPGDVVAWRLPNGLYHIGIVTSPTTVVHNIGYGAQSENVLHAFQIIGHYRW